MHVIWHLKAACFHVGNEIFFEIDNRPGSSEPAKEVCRACPVIGDCLAHALSFPEEDGVWGGTTPDGRKWFRRYLRAYDLEPTPELCRIEVVEGFFRLTQDEQRAIIRRRERANHFKRRSA